MFHIGTEDHAPENGKPSGTAGRKAPGLTAPKGTKTAELPKEERPVTRSAPCEPVDRVRPALSRRPSSHLIGRNLLSSGYG